VSNLIDGEAGQRNPPAPFMHGVRLDLGWKRSPHGEDLLGGLKIRDLQIAEGLLIDRLIVLVNAAVLAQKRQKVLIGHHHIFRKFLTRNGSSPMFQKRFARVDLLAPDYCKQARELIGDAPSIRGQIMACLVSSTQQHLPQAIAGEAVGLLNRASIRHAKPTSRTRDAPELLKKFRPILHPQKACGQAHIHSIKGLVGKFEWTPGIHDKKRDTGTELLGLSLGTRIADHSLIDIDPNQMHARIKTRRLNGPSTRTTPDIQQVMQPLWIRLL
jgi:hypothetical protein